MTGLARINSVYSFEGLIAECQKSLESFIPTKDMRDPNDPGNENEMRLQLIELCSKAAELFHGLHARGEYPKNRAQLTPQFSESAEKLHTLHATLSSVHVEKPPKYQLSQVLSSCLLPAIERDFAFLRSFASTLWSRAFHRRLSNRVGNLTCLLRVANKLPDRLQSIHDELTNLSSKIPHHSSSVSFIERFPAHSRIQTESERPNFHFIIHNSLKQLAKFPLGRRFLQKMHYLHTDEPLRIVEAQKDGSSCTSSTGVIRIADKSFLVIVKKTTPDGRWNGEVIFGKHPLVCTLAHEMTHRLHYLESPSKLESMHRNKENVPMPNFSNMEEYYTITGDDGEGNVNEFSENAFRKVLGLPERVYHVGSYFTLNGPIDEKLKKGTTKIHWSAKYGFLGFLREFLSQGPSVSLVNARNEDGYAALHLAIKGKHPEIIDLLVQYKADPCLANEKEQETSLHYAAATGVVDIARSLFSFGTQRVIDARNHLGRTALYCSIASGHAPVTKLLLERGADASIPSHENETSLHLAVQKGLIETCEDIVKSEKDPKKRKALLNAQNSGRETALHISISQDRPDIAELLIKAGASKCVYETMGQTPLHYATDLDSIPCMEVLFKTGKWDRQLLNAVDDAGRTALHYAVLRKSVDAVRLLLENGASTSIKDNDDDTPLDVAKNISDPVKRNEICKLLERYNRRWGLRLCRLS